jgi:hypothetical protein
MSRNTDTVKAIYESLGKGDVPAILARLAPDGLATGFRHFVDTRQWSQATA